MELVAVSPRNGGETAEARRGRAATSTTSPTDERGLIYTELLRVTPTVLVWAAFSYGLSYYNSWLLNAANDKFPYPFFYTMWHMVVSAVGLTVVFLCRPEMPRPSLAQFRAQWKLVLSWAAWTLLAIGGENAAGRPPVFFEPDAPGGAAARQLSEAGSPPPPTASGGCAGFPSRVSRGRGNFIARPGWDEETQTAWADRDGERWKAMVGDSALSMVATG